MSDELRALLVIGAIYTAMLVAGVLRLAGFVDWSWWWILAPLWIPAAAFVLLVVVLAWGFRQSADAGRK